MTETVRQEDLGDDRIIRETGIDARVALIVRPVLVSMGYRLVRVRLFGQDGLTLQIMAEREDGTMSVEDCEEVSRTLSPALDVEDPVEKAYRLEISSPGIDRPLVRKSDFGTWLGHLARIDTSILIGERKRFRGRIAQADDDGVVIERDQASYGDALSVRIPFEAICEARLLLTDDLIRDALKKDKQVRREARKSRGAALDDETETDN